MINLERFRGKFITFEGGEGTGKTTLSNRLQDEFEKQGIPVVKTRDPGGGETATKIREILLSSASNVSKNAELMLFFAARAQTFEEIIKPALVENKTVICDRWFDSTLAYQKDHPEMVLKMFFLYTCGQTPDITFLLDVDPFIGLQRSFNRLGKNKIDESKFEEKGLVFHNEIRQRYLKLFQENKNMHIIDAEKSLDECSASMYNILYHIK